jgi:hypothetical protein
MRGASMLILTALVIAACGPSASTASTPALWWKGVITRAISNQACISNAESGASHNGLNISRVTAQEVAGFYYTRDVYVAITCVERPGERAIAIIMGVADNARSAWAKSVVEDIAEGVRTAGVPE